MLTDEIAARHQIADLKARYCRGIDRCDLAMLESAFWPEATVSYGIFDGPALEFARSGTQRPGGAWQIRYNWMLCRLDTVEHMGSISGFILRRHGRFRSRR